MKINFDAIERRLKSIVESSSQLVSGFQGQVSFPGQLASAIESFLLEEEILDIKEFPKSLLIEVPTDSFSDWQEYPVQETLYGLLQDASIMPEIRFEINLMANSDLLPNEIRIRTDFGKAPLLDKTASMHITPSQVETSGNETMPKNAFIIINGLETKPIAKPVFNIGRRLNNDLVIEDPRISREHAQIRVVRGKFVIFDLNSSGGTFVNSIRVSNQSLFPGDVISLGGIPIVYGEDNPPPFSDTGQIEPFNHSDTHGKKP